MNVYSSMEKIPTIWVNIQYWSVFTIVELLVQPNQADMLLFDCMHLFDETVPCYDRMYNIIVQHEWFHFNFSGWLPMGTDILFFEIAESKSAFCCVISIWWFCVNYRCDLK